MNKEDAENTRKIRQLIRSPLAVNRALGRTLALSLGLYSKMLPLLFPEKDFVWVEGGTFLMGNIEGAPIENPWLLVTLEGFSLCRYTVSQLQWEWIMGRNPSQAADKPAYPVENVSWNDAQTFIRKLNKMTGKTYRLPTEAEWEYAARGGNQSKHYIYAGSNDMNQAAWHVFNSGNRSHPVAGRKTNELGLHHMSGNVWEWCNDWYWNYEPGEYLQPAGPSSGREKVLRGGCYATFGDFAKSTSRNRAKPSMRACVCGFRLAL